MNNAAPANAAGLPEDVPAPAEFAAALEFEPWDRQSGGWCPPTNAEWNEIGKWLLRTVRVAWLMMFKTKAELVETIEAMDREDVLLETIERFRCAEETLEGFLQVVRAASGRSACACAVIELRDSETNEGDDDQ